VDDEELPISINSSIIPLYRLYNRYHYLK